MTMTACHPKFCAARALRRVLPARADAAQVPTGSPPALAVARRQRAERVRPRSGGTCPDPRGPGAARAVLVAGRRRRPVPVGVPGDRAAHALQRRDGGPTRVHLEAARILVVDNYDSFVFTIVGYLAQLGASCEVVRNDAVTRRGRRRLRRGAALPRPRHARGRRRLHGRWSWPAPSGRSPCSASASGHQALGVAYGGEVGRAPELLHGKTCRSSTTAPGCWPGCPSRSPRPATTR